MDSKFKIKPKFKRNRAGVPYSQSQGKKNNISDVPCQNVPLSISRDVEEHGTTSLEESHPQKDMADDQHYGHLLHSLQCVTVVEQGVFCALDYDVNKRSVRNHVYIFVHRRPHKVPQGYDWTMFCSCDRVRSEFVKSLDSKLDKCVEEDPDCLHLRAMKIYLSFHDIDNSVDVEQCFQSVREDHVPDHTYSMHNEQDHFKKLPGGSSVIGVKPVAQTWGACTITYTKVTPPTPQIYCTTCKRYNCTHALAVIKGLELINAEGENNDLQSFKHEFETTPEMRRYFEASALSVHKVSLFTEHDDDRETLRNLASFNGRKFVVPAAEGHCDHCGAKWNDAPVSAGWLEVDTCIVGCSYETQDISVYYRPCSSCDRKKQYDGIEDGLLWFGNFAFTHTVLRDYLRFFVICNLPMHKYYVAYTQKQISSGNFNFITQLSYTKFRLAVIAMIRLLDIDYQEGYHCSICGTFPRQVVMDGTALGIQRVFMNNDEQLEQPQEIFDGRFNTRNFLNSKSCRELLRKFCLEDVTPEVFIKLKTGIQSLSPSLYAMLQAFEGEGFLRCPTSYRRLLLVLSSDQAVCAFIPPKVQVTDLLQEIVNGLNPKEGASSHMKVLQEHVPVLFDIFSKWNANDRLLLPLLGEVLEKVYKPFKEDKGEFKQPHLLPQVMLQKSNRIMFPTLPQLVHRGKYLQDEKTKKKDDCAKASHLTMRHASLTPGLFTMSCIHGICYGFEQMKNHESPDVPFTLMRTRFPEAPDIVIYDMACKLHQYCLNRDPAFFRGTKFFVDKFHWKNHKACSEAYNISQYALYEMVNSQLAEQLNSLIKPLSAMLCYMEQENFAMFTKLHIYYRNMIRKYKTVPDGKFSYEFLFKPMSKIVCKS